MVEYVTRIPVDHGNEDGSKLYLKPGDPISAAMVGEDTLTEMRARGNAVPVAVWEGLKQAVTAEAKAQESKAEAEAELLKLNATPAAAGTYESSVAHKLFLERVERENAKVQEEQGGVELDAATGHQKTDVSPPVVTGSTPSPGVSSLSIPEVARREQATVADAMKAQEAANAAKPAPAPTKSNVK